MSYLIDDPANQSRLMSPGLAMAFQAMTNIGRQNSGMQPGISPYQAYQQSVIQQNEIMNRRKLMEMRQQEMEQQQSLRDLQMQEARRNMATIPNIYQNMPTDIQTWKLSGSTQPYDEWARTTAAGNAPAYVQQYMFGENLREQDPEAYQRFVSGQRAPTTVKFGDATLLLDPSNPQQATVVGPEGLETVDDVSEWIKGEAASKAAGIKYAENVEEQNAAFRMAAQNMPELEGALADTEQLIQDIQSGQYQKTGFLEGRLARYTDKEVARLQAKAVMQALKNLQITKLTPVSNFEIDLIQSLYADVLSDPIANIGKLEEAADVLRGKIEGMNRMGQYYVDHGNTLENYQIMDRWTSSSPAQPQEQPQLIEVPDELLEN
jgi:hypothetical protein